MAVVVEVLALLLVIFLVGALIILAVQDLLVARHDQEDDLSQTADLRGISSLFSLVKRYR